jgi:hypothetical protein
MLFVELFERGRLPFTRQLLPYCAAARHEALGGVDAE